MDRSPTLLTPTHVSRPWWLLAGIFWLTFVVVFGLWLRGTACSAPASQYTLLSLGDVRGFAIDREDDTVVGVKDDAEGFDHAVILFPEVRDLGFLPGGRFARATAVAGGTICGWSGEGAFSLHAHAFRWDATTGLHDLGTTGDPNLVSACEGTNLTRQAGYGDEPTEARHVVPLIWDNGAAPRILPTGTQSGGFAGVINDAGDVCGQRRTDPPAAPQFLSTCWWNEDLNTPVNIHTLGGDFSIPTAINTQRQVCGVTTVPGAGPGGFIYDPAGGMRVVVKLPNDTQSRCNDLNDLGDYVGTSRLPNTRMDPEFLHEVAVIWGPDGQPIDLNTRVRNLGGRVLNEALGISNRGTIIARVGSFEDEEFVLLIPDTTVVVPPEEPKPHGHHWHGHGRAPRDPQHWASGNPRLAAIADLIEAAQQEHAEQGHGQGRRGR